MTRALRRRCTRNAPRGSPPRRENRVKGVARMTAETQRQRARDVAGASCCRHHNCMSHAIEAPRGATADEPDAPPPLSARAERRPATQLVRAAQAPHPARADRQCVAARSRAALVCVRQADLRVASLARPHREARPRPARPERHRLAHRADALLRSKRTRNPRVTGPPQHHAAMRRRPGGPQRILLSHPLAPRRCQRPRLIPE